MKQEDIAKIIAVVVFSVIVSIFVSKYTFGKPTNRQQNVETVQAVSSSFSEPSGVYFNTGSIDPTQSIQTGQENNQNPFGSSGN